MEGLREFVYLGLDWCVGYGEVGNEEGLFLIIICKEVESFFNFF